MMLQTSLLRITLGMLNHVKVAMQIVISLHCHEDSCVVKRSHLVMVTWVLPDNVDSRV